MRDGEDSKTKVVPMMADPQPLKPTRAFNQMAFGPWTTNDPKIQRTIVRTNASGGITQKKFQGTYPAPPTIAQTKTAITGGFEFAINLSSGSNLSGYNVYSSTVNNGNVATLLRFVSQPSVTKAGLSVKFQDITAANPFYWVASINSAGKESIRVPVSGNPAPSAVNNKPLPVGGGSGFGSSGGGGRSGLKLGKRV